MVDKSVRMLVFVGSFSFVCMLGRIVLWNDLGVGWLGGDCYWN